MTDQDLRDQIEELFSDGGLEPEIDQSELLLGEAVDGLLTDEAEPGAATTGQEAVELHPPLSAEPEEFQEEGEIAPAGTRLREIPSTAKRTRIFNILLLGATALGGALLIFLLIHLIWQGSTTWSGFYTLFFAAYTVGIIITLVQWMFNSSLTKALREAEEKRDEAVRSHIILGERMDELATANAPLQKRVLQFEAAVRIFRDISSVLNTPGDFLRHTVNLIREQFGLYHVGLFLIDESGQWAVLRAGASETSGHEPAKSYRFEVSDTSTVGWCVANGQARTAPNLATASRQNSDEVNSLLSEVRLEAALPLRSQGQVIGALYLQSTEREAFSQEDIAILQMVADQMAEAIDYTQSYAEIQTRLEEAEAHPGRPGREQAPHPASDHTTPSYERSRSDVAPAGSSKMPDRREELDQAIAAAIAHRQVVVQSDTGNGTGQAALVAPISLRDETLGALGLQEAQGGRRWTSDEIALVEAVADQLALAIENARLLEETEQRAEREQTLSQMTARFTRSLDMNALLQTAVRELGQLLQADEVSVFLGTPPADEAEEKEQ